MTVKEQVRQAVDALPDDCTMDDVHYRMYVLTAIGEGLRDLEEGRKDTHSDFSEKIAKWSVK